MLLSGPAGSFELIPRPGAYAFQYAPAEQTTGLHKPIAPHCLVPEPVVGSSGHEYKLIQE